MGQDEGCAGEVGDSSRARRTIAYHSTQGGPDLDRTAVKPASTQLLVTCLAGSLSRTEASLIGGHLPTLTDLGYLNLCPAIRDPFKKPKFGEPTEAQSTFNTLIRGVHGVAERPNALLKRHRIGKRARQTHVTRHHAQSIMCRIQAGIQVSMF